MSRRIITAFTLTGQHLALMRRMYVVWQHVEYGAPEVDPKRPYGNSDVEADIASIIGLVPDIDTGDGLELSDEQRELCRRLHHETQQAVQIMLSLGEVPADVYELADDGRWRQRWESEAG